MNRLDGATLSLSVATVLALLAGNGCVDESDVTAPHQPVSEGGRAMAGPLIPSTEPLAGKDKEFAELALRVPGFAGLYFDHGTPVVRLLDGSQRGAAEDALRTILAPRAQAAPGLTFADADYGFLQLAEWRQKSPALLSISGVVSVAIDERANRLRIGVASEGAHKQLLETLGTLGIPNEAVIVDSAGPAQNLTTILDYVRPLPGGLKIAFLNSFCTLGFNAYLEGQIAPAFLTAAHCGSHRGQVDYDYFYNPTRTSESYHVGTETMDPPGLAGGSCPTGYTCRWSDVEVATYAGASPDFATLARTVTRVTNGFEGPLEIDPERPRLHVTGMFPYPYQGEIVDHIGVHSGWTAAEVEYGCVDKKTLDGWMFWCQTYVSGIGEPGDSGGPVFYFYNDSSAVLVGILWGASDDYPYDINHYYMSPVDNIAADGIQIQSVTQPPPPPPPPPAVYISGPSSGYPYSYVQESAIASSGTPPYTYSWTINGSPSTCGDHSTCTGRLGAPETYTTFSVTVTDADLRHANASWPVYACGLRLAPCY